MLNGKLKEEKMKSLSKDAIFYIKYYAKKHDMVIERKATLDENCFEGRHKKFGYPYKKYIDVWATEEINNDTIKYKRKMHVKGFN